MHKNDKKNNTPLSHDNFVRKSLSDKKIAAEFFETHLPKEILSQVDLSTLEQQKENYFDNTLGHGIVDLLYSVKFGQDEGYLVLLLEHVRHEVAHLKSVIYGWGTFKPKLPLSWCVIGNDEVLSKIESLTKIQSWTENRGEVKL